MPKRFRKGDEVGWGSDVYRVVSGAVEKERIPVINVSWDPKLIDVKTGRGVFYLPVEELEMVKAAAEPEGPWRIFHRLSGTRVQGSDEVFFEWLMRGEERSGIEPGTKWRVFYSGLLGRPVVKLYRRLWSRRPGGHKVLVQRQDEFETLEEAKAWVDRQVLEKAIVSRFARTEPL